MAGLVALGRQRPSPDRAAVRDRRPRCLALPILGPRLPPKAILPSQVQPAPFVALENRRARAAQEIVGDRHVFGQQCAASASQAIVERDHGAQGVHHRVVGDDRVFDLVVLVDRRVGNAGRDGNRATGPIVNIGDVVVDDRLPLADDANRPRLVLVLAQKKVPFDPRVVAVAEGQACPPIRERCCNDRCCCPTCWR